MGWGACARILKCRFLVPYSPFIVVENSLNKFVSLLQFHQNSLPPPPLCTIEACVSVGEL